MKPHYYVFNPGPNYANEIPNDTQCFYSLKEAQIEAERLARIHIGSSFEILKCVGISRVDNPPTITFFTDGTYPNEYV